VRRLVGRLVDAGAADEQELPHAGRLRPVRHRPARTRRRSSTGHHGHDRRVTHCHVMSASRATQQQRRGQRVVRT
jgi:hypothetical protein